MYCSAPSCRFSAIFRCSVSVIVNSSVSSVVRSETKPEIADSLDLWMRDRPMAATPTPASTRVRKHMEAVGSSLASWVARPSSR